MSLVEKIKQGHKILILPHESGWFFDTKARGKVAAITEDIELLETKSLRSEELYEIKIEGEKPIYVSEKNRNVFLASIACKVDYILPKKRICSLQPLSILDIIALQHFEL